MCASRREDMNISLEDFKRYVLLRRDAFENKYGLKTLTSKELLLDRRHYPNNLRYLDATSQILIRTLNNHPVPLRDKLLTVFVYRMVGDKMLVRRYANKKGVYTLKELNKLAKYLNNDSVRLKNRYATPLAKTGITGLTKGEFLLASSCDFLDKLPKDNFYRWKTSEIARQFVEFEKVYGISYAMASQFASDISYINELEIRIDFIRTVPERAREMYCMIMNTNFRVEKYEEFTNEMMSWYIEQDFLDNKECLVVPQDITQMLLGYRYYVMDSGGVLLRFRKPTKTKSRIGGIVIARSMYDYYKQSMGS